jgi:hypothetical protein
LVRKSTGAPKSDAGSPATHKTAGARKQPFRLTIKGRDARSIIYDNNIEGATRDQGWSDVGENERIPATKLGRIGYLSHLRSLLLVLVRVAAILARE